MESYDGNDNIKYEPETGSIILIDKGATWDIKWDKGKTQDFIQQIKSPLKV